MVENSINVQVHNDFNQIFGIINYHRQRVSKTVDDESLRMIWEVGGYVSKKLKASEWGSNIVRQLSEYIRTQDPTIKGWSYRTIYKMVQFYEVYSSISFKNLLQTTNLVQFTKLELPSKAKDFVPFETAQIPTILFSTGWTNHQIIMNRCKSDDERLFYILFAQKEHLQNKQLERAIKTDTMASILRAKDIQSETLHTLIQNRQPFSKTLHTLTFLDYHKDIKRQDYAKELLNI